MKVELELKTLGDMLYFKMRSERVSGVEVAKSTGLSTSTISRVSNGKTMHVGHVIPIAKWLELTPQELWDFLEMYK